MKALDAAVLDAVARALDAAVVADAVRGAVAMLTAGHADAATRRATIAGELATIATRERKLLDALVDGDAAVSGSIEARLATSWPAATCWRPSWRASRRWRRWTLRRWCAT